MPLRPDDRPHILLIFFRVDDCKNGYLYHLLKPLVSRSEKTVFSKILPLLFHHLLEEPRPPPI
ncbi:hypothetical protein HanIR_Chr08g0382221 [Helianthus annuus]|nr:hypothetical protein HanIR_Chr08g0382221 [Helianthus annuus]